MKPTEHNILGPLAKALNGWLPPVLKMAVEGECLPLAIGTGEALEKLLVTKAAMPQGDAHRVVRRTLYHYAQSRRYLETVASEVSWRYDLDGKPVERIAIEHQLAASNRLLAQQMRFSAKGNGKPVNARPKPKPEPKPKPADARNLPSARAKPDTRPTAARW